MLIMYVVHQIISMPKFHLEWYDWYVYNNNVTELSGGQKALLYANNTAYSNLCNLFLRCQVPE